jgi:hypothetical protein
MAVSKKLCVKAKLSPLKGYEIAHLAGIHPSTLSKIICGIDKAEHGDSRVIAVGRILGISAEECFEGENTH